MKKVKIKGKRRVRYFAEWKDIAKIVSKHLKENKKFYEELASL